MELGYAKPQRLRRRPHYWLQVTLLVGFLFCLLLGLGALAMLVLLRDEQPAASRSAPAVTFPRDQIVPNHALMQLAGDPASALAYQAIQAGELDTAYAIALFDVAATDPQRLALLLQLGRRYLDAARPEDAAAALNLARSTATLGRDLSPQEQSQALVQIADALLNAEADAAALDVATQAMRVAAQAPELLPAQRSQIFESLRPLAERLNDDLFDQQINELARNPYLSPTGVLVDTDWITLTQSLPPDPAVEAAIAARGQAARVLADRIALTGGIDIEPERQSLAAALTAEDAARAIAVQQGLGAGLAPEQQLALLLDRRAWLALKARVALGGFGLTVAPEWEATASAILDELSATTMNAAALIDAMAAARPQPVDQAMLRTDALYWLAQQVEFGLLTGVTSQDLGERMRLAQSEMARLGTPPALPILLDDAAEPPGFRVAPPSALLAAP
jgi:hypothetical protein